MFTWILARAFEATTWAGLSSFALLLDTQLPPVAQPYDLIAAAIFAGLAVVMREKGTKAPEQIAADAFAAAQAIRSPAPPIAVVLLAACVSLAMCAPAFAGVPLASLPIDGVTPLTVLIGALAIVALLWILVIALFTGRDQCRAAFARCSVRMRAFIRASRRVLLAGAVAVSLFACGTDPVGDLIAGYTAADSAAATFLAANTNADTAAKVKACEAAAYGVLEPVKTAWVAGITNPPAVLSAASSALTVYQACLTDNGVKL